MGPLWQNPIQRTVRTAHLSVLLTVHSFGTQYKTEQFWQSPLLPPDKHHSSDVVYQRRGDERGEGRNTGTTEHTHTRTQTRANKYPQHQTNTSPRPQSPSPPTSRHLRSIQDFVKGGGTMMHLSPGPLSADESWEFYISKMVAAAILQKMKICYVCGRLTHSEEIWHGEVSQISGRHQPEKITLFEIQDGVWKSIKITIPENVCPILTKYVYIFHLTCLVYVPTFGKL